MIRKKISLLLFASLIPFSVWCQSQAPWSFKVVSYGQFFKPQNKTTMPDEVYFDLDENPSTLAVGDNLDVICREGARYSFSLISSGEVPGTRGFRVHLKPLADPSALMMANELDYFMVPAGTTIFDAGNDTPDFINMTTEGDPAPMLDPVLFTQINGVQWSGGLFPNSVRYYEKGNSSFDTTGKPVLIMAFRAANAPDKRQLTIQVRNFTGTGTYSQPEVLLSGSENGDPALTQMFTRQDNPDFPEQKTSFTVNIADWHRPSENNAFISCTFSGKLKGLKGAPDVELTQGIFQKVEVMIYTEKY